MRIPEIELLQPTSVAEACAILAEDPEGSAPFAGGTDILVHLRTGAFPRRRLVSLGRIPELRDISWDHEAGLAIGAMVTVNGVARSEEVQRRYPGIVEAALCLAADQVRNQATVAGNLCMAVPSADMAPILLAHDARLEVASSTGGRIVPVRELFVAPRRTVLSPGEVVTAIGVPPPAPGSGDASRRQGGRATLSLPIASAAAVVRMDGAVCREAALALGAVAPTPLLVAGVAELLVGVELTPERLSEAGELAGGCCRPIDDVRASRAYRVEVVKVLTRRALAAAAERAAGR